MKPLFSIAIATLNGEKYLRDQLDSIYAQTWNNLEVVVSDDGSSDRTVNILKEYAYHRGLRFQQTDSRLGLVGNFSAALSLCQGRFVALCDQDDVWKPHKLQRLADALDRSALAYCNTSEYIESDGVTRFDRSQEPILDFARRQSRHPTRQLLAENWIVGHTLAMRRSVLDYALPIPPGQTFHDGWLALVASKLEGVEFLDEHLQVYRRHSASYTWKEPQIPPRRSLRGVFSSFRQAWRDLCLRETRRLSDCVRLELLSNDDRAFLSQLLIHYRSGIKPGWRSRSARAGWLVAPYFSSPSRRGRTKAFLRAVLSAPAQSTAASTMERFGAEG